MVIRLGSKKQGRWWPEKFHLIFIVFLSLLIKPQESNAFLPPPAPSNICTSPTCLVEAARIVQQIDPSVDPCTDFYQFACGNYLKNAHGDESFNVWQQLEAESKRQLLEMYVEEIRGEHKMVKIAKTLFNKCMNKTEIEMDRLETIRLALKEAGGWPVLEDQHWDDTKFDWFRTTYKLRQLGYPYSVLVDLQIQKDEVNKGSYIFKVATAGNSDLEKLRIESATYSNKEVDCLIESWNVDGRPDCQHFLYSLDYQEYINSQDNLEKMIEAAVIFRSAKTRDEISKEVTEAAQFWEKLKKFRYVEAERVTLEEFQQSYGPTFDWTKFINLLAGPLVNVTKDDYVLFQPADHLKSLLELISQTPKRTLANYMMWRVVEQQLPYLTKDLQKLETTTKEYDTRAEFCASTVTERFTPNPVEIMWNRKLLPAGKQKYVQELNQNFKSQLMEALKNVDWMEEADKNKVVEQVRNLTVVIAQPIDIFDDKVLDDLDVDMIATNTDTFLGLLAAVSRNHQSRIYNRIKKTISENPYDKWYYKYNLLRYDDETNTQFVPSNFYHDAMVNERRPNYINYGHLNHIFYGLLMNLLRQSTTEEVFQKKQSRLNNAVKNATSMSFKNVSDRDERAFLFMYYQMTLDKIAHDAYEKWVTQHGEEQTLIGVDYTPRQLFWISTANCRIANKYSNFKTFHYILPRSSTKSYGGLTTMDIEFSNLAGSKCMRNNSILAKEFHCPAESTLDPSANCQLF